MKLNFLTVSDSNYLKNVAALFYSLSLQNQHELYWGHIDGDYVHLKRITPYGIDLVQSKIAQIPVTDTIVEASTRFRPLLLKTMFDICDCDIGCYIDPDIFIYDSLEELVDSTASVWVTPHLLTVDILNAREAKIRECAISQAFSLQRWGAFNMGLYFVRNNAIGRDFLECYQIFLDRACEMESLYSFVDQKWMDVLASLFQSQVEILSHPGVNLSYWNLPYRSLKYQNGMYFVNGVRLKAIHFSGVKSFRIDGNYGQGEEIKALIADYQKQLSNSDSLRYISLVVKNASRKSTFSWVRFARKVMFYFLSKTESR